MKVRGARRLQIIALAIAVAVALLCALVATRPSLIGITGPEGIDTTPVAALANSLGCIVIGGAYLALMARIRTENGSRWAVIIISLLLCVLSVVVEPLLGSYETWKISLLLPEADSAATVITAIQAEEGMQEFARQLLFISKTLTLLSLGGFWKNPALAGKEA